MEEKTEEKINMISAASRALDFIKDNPLAIPEEVFQDLADFISRLRKDEKTKLLMVAAASRAVKILKESPKITNKQVLKQVMKELNSIIMEVSQEITN
jgi:hypothetical protein